MPSANSLLSDSQLMYVMLAMPTLFGLTLIGESMYRMSQFQSGWVSMILGIIFLAVVAFGFFYLKGYL